MQQVEEAVYLGNVTIQPSGKVGLADPAVRAWRNTTRVWPP